MCLNMKQQSQSLWFVCSRMSVWRFRVLTALTISNWLPSSWHLLTECQRWVLTWNILTTIGQTAVPLSLSRRVERGCGTLPENPSDAYIIDLTCSGSDDDNQTCLKYYADEDHRRWWAKDWPDDPMPEAAVATFDRDSKLPQPPFWYSLDQWTS